MDSSIEALVVDGSSVARDLLVRLLGPRCARVTALASTPEALARIASEGAPRLVLVDAEAPGGGPWPLLRALASEANDVAVLARKADPSSSRALCAAGALDVLPKPVSIRDLMRLLRQVRREPFPPVPPRVRGRTPIRAELLDGESGAAEVLWEVHDLSVSGALLLSHAPVPVGARLDLRLRHGRLTAYLAAEVVRIQEPSWSCVPGVAVRFHEVSQGLREMLAELGSAR